MAKGTAHVAYRTVEAAKIPREYLLYRAWADDELLYIGVTMNRRARFKLHSQSTWWWRLKTHVTTEHLGLLDRKSARAIESQAIQDEQPLLNTMGRLCIVPGCGARAKALMVCKDHYGGRWWDRPTLEQVRQIRGPRT